MKFATTLFAFAAAAISLAAPVTGVWHGQFMVDHASLPKPKSPTQASMMARRIQAMDATLAKAKVTLTFKSNHTYSFNGVGLPGSAGPQTSEGGYTQTATTVTISPKTENGKPALGSAASPQTFAIGNKGRTLTLIVPNAGGVKVSIIFKR